MQPTLFQISAIVKHVHTLDWNITFIHRETRTNIHILTKKKKKNVEGHAGISKIKNHYVYQPYYPTDAKSVSFFFFGNSKPSNN